MGFNELALVCEQVINNKSNKKISLHMCKLLLAVEWGL